MQEPEPVIVTLEPTMVQLSVTPTLLLALYAQRWLVEGLSLGAVKG